MIIKKITKLEKSEVYDIINVKNNNNYIVNDFVVHNSAADWNTRESKELRKKLAQVRTKHLLFILCFPLKIYKMEKTYLECLDGDTLIDTENGIKKIKQLEGIENFKVMSYNEKSKLFEYKKASKCIKTKNDTVYSIKTNSGYNIRATKDHRFLTYDGWKHLYELDINDLLFLNNGKYSTIQKITEQEKIDVYDILNVEDNHNYIANNLVVHNSFVNYWCITGDTKIITRDINGMIRQTPIKELNKHNPEVLSYNINTKQYEFKKYEKKIKTKKNAEVFEVELINGLKIKVTEDHLFLTQRGWVKLKELNESDEIEVYLKSCKWCNKEFVQQKMQQIFCCKKCNAAFHVRDERQFKYGIQYRESHKEENKKLCSDRYYKKHDEILKNIKQKYYANRTVILQKHREYRKKNRDKILVHEKRILKKNINYKISKILRSRLIKVLSVYKTKKTCSTFKYLGCSIEELKEYISKQFKDGMSWDNWGKFTWHIDHKKPCSHFDLSNEEERYKCFNYKNLQPLWATENLQKGNRYED